MRYYMKTILSTISGIISKAFEECGYDPSFGKVSVSNRPDLCEYQCNGAMAAAKQYHKAPFMIADEIVAKLQENDAFSKAESVKPGFINLDLSGSFICGFLSDMEKAENFGCEKEEEPQTIVIDYGGPNVAKPLHIGHLRSAIIGESIKRINRFFGNNVIGDVHLGDWGLQMGLIIEELKDRKPDLPYFDESFSGEYPKEPPFTLSDLEEIYPAASKKAKACKEGTKELTEEAAEFSKRAHLATLMLQQDNRGYQALWHHILDLSIPDLKKNYDKLGVSFDIWKAESDAKPFIADMIKDIKDKGLAYESQGALVVDVAESSDQKEIPPLILTKSDGSALYPTTDLATLVDRERTYHPDKVIYVVDKRQEMHFTQVFRAARMAGIVRPETYLIFLGFGTMNGKDGKPFKTRAGGVMRLETLIDEIYTSVFEKSLESEHLGENDDREKVCMMIAMAALKYGDLSNQASKDYIFDIERFSSFDGNSGPYILYNTVRIKTILSKYAAENRNKECCLMPPSSKEEKQLCLTAASFIDAMNDAYANLAPHRICGFLYDLASAFNAFYNSVKILTEPDHEKQQGYIALIDLTKRLLETGMQLLGFAAPERM